MGQADPFGERLAALQITPIDILEGNTVRAVVQQGAEQIAFIGQGGLGFLKLGESINNMSLPKLANLRIPGRKESSAGALKRIYG